jgi:hypothetical protein
MLLQTSLVGTANPQTQDSLWIRENGENYWVTFSGNWVDYANGENCSNTSHRTAKGSRFFAHAHINYSLPATGFDSSGQQRTVTLSKIKAYWDNYYNMASSGSEDHTYNCWGYAFGYSTWVQDLMLL